MDPKEQKKTLKKIRIYLVIFFFGILFSLHTVLFVEPETEFFYQYLGPNTTVGEKLPFFSEWIEDIYISVKVTYTNYPAIAYCMDWLSYACVVFAIFMIGAIKDPVKNIWIIQAYMLACLLAAALPFIAGPFRDIPIFWRCLDGSFGIIGFLVLLTPYKLTKTLQKLAQVA
ncbi:MAG: hypothetical protein FVQ82_09785 [Planctomycetes bacterium]|nr:hypothetical protein [Planctomycetota bacterium]